VKRLGFLAGAAAIAAAGVVVPGVGPSLESGSVEIAEYYLPGSFYGLASAYVKLVVRSDGNFTFEEWIAKSPDR
jgi:hypothetical protein